MAQKTIDKDEKKSKYNGHIASCMRHGDGSYDYPGASYKYHGDWVYGVKNGKNGKFALPGLFTYEGEFLNGEITGKGSRKWADGRVYSGEWLNGEMHGTGTWQNASATEIYEGQYDNNKRQGDGILTIRGDVYKGKFGNNIYEGMGIYLRERKYVLECNFVKGICQGMGSITWNKLATFEGKFRNGIPYEHGLFTAADGSFCYLGDFANAALGTSATAVAVNLDPSGERKTALPSAVIGGAAPAPAKKGAPTNDPASTMLPVFGQGEWCGSLLLHLGDQEAVAVAGSDTQLSLPPPCEITRRVYLSLTPVEDPNISPEEAEASESQALPLRLWQRKHTMDSLAQSWARFPSTVCRVLGGVNKLTGDRAIASTQSTNYLPPNTEQEHEDQEKEDVATIETTVDVFGVECHRLCNTNSSINDLATTFLPLAHFLQESWSTEASFVVDFRLDLWQLVKQLQKCIIKQKKAVSRLRTASRGSGVNMRSPSRVDLSDDDGSSSVTSRGKLSLYRNSSRAEVAPTNDDGSASVSPSSRGRLASRDGKLDDVPPVVIEVPVMRVEYTGDADMCEADSYLQLVMMVSNNDPTLTALFDKITDVTENKVALEKQRVAALQKIEEEKVKAAEEEAEKLLREATGEDKRPLKKKPSRKGCHAPPPVAVEEPLVITPLLPCDVSIFNTTVTWELRRVSRNQSVLDLVAPYTVLSKWRDTSFNVLTWHSISLTLRDVTVPVSPLAEGSSPSAELYVDGHGKVKQEVTQELMSLDPLESVGLEDGLSVAEAGVEALSVVIPKTDSLIAEWLNSACDPPHIAAVDVVMEDCEEPAVDATEGEGVMAVAEEEAVEPVSVPEPVTELQPAPGATSEAEPTEKLPPRNITLTVGGPSFSGYVKLLGVYNKWHRCTAQEVTACFDQYHADYGLDVYWEKLLMNNPDDAGICRAALVEEVPVETTESKPSSAAGAPPLEKLVSAKGGAMSKQASTVSVPKSALSADATPPPVPSGEYPSEDDCVPMDALPVVCRGGRCEITQLVIPPDTPPGVYTLVIKDGVDPEIFLSPEVEDLAAAATESVNGAEEDTGTPATPATTNNPPASGIFPGGPSLENVVALPSQLDDMYKVVTRLPDNRSYRIIVSSELLM